MSIVTPGIVPASILLAAPRPDWPVRWGGFAAALRFEDLPGPVVAALVLLDSLRAEALTDRGDTEAPYNDDEVRDKFRDLAGPVRGPADAERIVAAVAALDRGRFFGLLAAPPCETSDSLTEHRNPPPRQAEVLAKGEPRSTHDRAACFEAPLRRAPQHEDVGYESSGSGEGPQ